MITMMILGYVGILTTIAAIVTIIALAVRATRRDAVSAHLAVEQRQADAASTPSGADQSAKAAA